MVEKVILKVIAWVKDVGSKITLLIIIISFLLNVTHLIGRIVSTTTSGFKNNTLLKYPYLSNNVDTPKLQTDKNGYSFYSIYCPSDLTCESQSTRFHLLNFLNLN